MSSRLLFARFQIRSFFKLMVVTNEQQGQNGRSSPICFLVVAIFLALRAIPIELKPSKVSQYALTLQWFLSFCLLKNSICPFLSALSLKGASFKSLGLIDNSLLLDSLLHWNQYPYLSKACFEVLNSF